MLAWIRLSSERRDAFDHEVRNLIDGGRIGRQPAVLDELFAPAGGIDWTVTEVDEGTRALTITFRVDRDADPRAERLAWASVRLVTRGGHSGPA